MPRIHPLSPEQADSRTAGVLRGVQRKLGLLPNVVATLAQSPAALGACLGSNEALAAGVLSPQQRELIAIAVAEANACDYCLSAHAALAAAAGLSDEDISRARRGDAVAEVDRAILGFALAVVRSRGQVDDAELAAVRRAGLGDGLLVEVLGQVSLNLLTNYLNRLAGTDIDFPILQVRPAA